MLSSTLLFFQLESAEETINAADLLVDAQQLPAPQDLRYAIFYLGAAQQAPSVLRSDIVELRKKYVVQMNAKKSGVFDISFSNGVTAQMSTHPCYSYVSFNAHFILFYSYQLKLTLLICYIFVSFRYQTQFMSIVFPVSVVGLLMNCKMRRRRQMEIASLQRRLLCTICYNFWSGNDMVTQYLLSTLICFLPFAILVAILPFCQEASTIVTITVHSILYYML
jgi:hypothetical protein